METSKSLFTTGEHAFKRGAWKQALAAFGGVVAAQPAHLKTRFRIADALLNSGRRELAVDVYKAIAWHAIKSGFPLLGLVATKMVLLLDPSYEDVLVVLADLYSGQSDRLDRTSDGPAAVELGGDTAKPLSEEGEALLVKAAKLAADTEGSLSYPSKLPPIPLFSYLDEDSFIEVLAKLRLRRYADEEVIIRQGERGESFFMIADGDVLIKRDVDDDDGGVMLANLHRGSVFGELALISDEPRQASAIAKGDVDVLEMKRSDLVVASSQLEGVTEAMKLFTRERFLRNLTATHPFFSSLSREQRHKVGDLFKIVRIGHDAPLIKEGTKGPGLFLLLGGAAEVSKAGAGDRVHLATLKGGDLCGEMSLLGDSPTTATVTAVEDMEALFLSRDDFHTVVREHPELVKYLAGLTDERLRQNRALLHSRGLLEDDEHVMI